MLYTIDHNAITSIPRRRQDDYRRWRANLSDEDFQKAVEGIRARLAGKQFVVSSFLPGSDWTDTEFQPLYVATGRRKQEAGWFFGLIVWQTIINHEEEWCFLPADKDDDQALGMRYFRRNRPGEPS